MKKKGFHKALSIVTSFLLLVQSFAPFIQLSYQKVYSAEPLFSKISFDKSANSFNIEVNTKENEMTSGKISYILLYKNESAEINNQIEAVEGNTDLTSENFTKSIEAKTCSTNGACVKHKVSRGILKVEIKESGWFNNKRFSVNSDNVSVSSESSVGNLTDMSDSDKAWLESGKDEIVPTVIPTASPTGPPTPTPISDKILDGISIQASPIPTNTPTLEPTINTPVTPTVVQVLNSKTGDESIELEIVNPSVTYADPAIWTNQADYAPTDIATVTGQGFTFGYTYKIIVTSEDHPSVNHEGLVSPEADGTIFYQYQLDGHYRPNYKVEVKDQTGLSIAKTTFTDALPATLTLSKIVYNNEYFGTAKASDWFLRASGSSNSFSLHPVLDPENPNIGEVTHMVTPGVEYTLSEYGGPSGYSASTWECYGGHLNGNKLTVDEGEDVNCTIANTQNPATILVLVKTVTNDNDGTATPADWVLSATSVFDIFEGTSTLSGHPIIDLEDSTVGQIYGVVSPGVEYTLSETGGPSGYTASAWECNGETLVGNKITVPRDEIVTCTINNDDIAPAILTLTKMVTSEYGGTAKASDWTLKATNGSNSPINGKPTLENPEDTTIASITKNVTPGVEYTLSETAGPSGYTADGWYCDSTGEEKVNKITLEPGDEISCSIENIQIPVTSLTLEKYVYNDFGGTATPNNWTLSATPVSGGAISLSGHPINDPVYDSSEPLVGRIHGNVTPNVEYVLSESSTPSGYTPDDWYCDRGTLEGNRLTLSNNEFVTCSINNYQNPPTTLTLIKIVNNIYETTTTKADAWTLRAQSGSTYVINEKPTLDPDDTTLASITKNVIPGVEYTLSETAGPSGYTADGWYCDGIDDLVNKITLNEGENINCSINNNEDPVTSLTLIKTVTNDNEGTASPVNWILSATPTSGSGASFSGHPVIIDPEEDPMAGQIYGVVTPGVQYTLSESGGPSGYTASDWDCDGDIVDGNKITLSEGDMTTCTINNDDNAPTRLTLVKTVNNNYGGTAIANNWILTATGSTGSFSGVPANNFGDNTYGEVSHLVIPGVQYTLSESGGPSGYTASAWECFGGTQVGTNKITVSMSDDVTCFIENNDNPATLIVKKIVTNNNGGSANPSNFQFSVNNGTPVNFEADGQNNLSVNAGTYNITEPANAGYTTTYSNCTNIVLAIGQTQTCTITNDDKPATLIVKKTVINDNGGTATASNFKFSVNGGTAVNFETDGENNISINAGSYSVTEPAVTGYAATYDNCSGTLSAGQTKTCTITNNDIAPVLTLVKTVTNNNGGTAQPSEWTLNATGSTRSFAGTNGVSGSIFANTQYTLTETAGPSGYTASNWSCNGGTLSDNKITLNVGQNVTCTINNNDNPATLIIKKVVTNDNGGTLTAPSFRFSVNGGSSVAFEADGENSLTVNAGPFNVTEPTVAGYASTLNNCSGTLVSGQTQTCTITNNDIAPSLTLIKTVLNNNNGNAIADNWTLTATGPTTISGAGGVVSGPTFRAGEYALTETSGPSGYVANPWSCSGVTIHDGNEVTLTLGQVATCSIVNDDKPATLIVKKTVINDNGGTLNASNFSFSVNGGTSINFESDGQNDLTVNTGTFNITEPVVTGYAATFNNCSNITLAAGEIKTCTITNNDVAPSLTLVKTVTNNNGGAAIASNWTLIATGTTTISGAGGVVSGSTFKTGQYTLTESVGPSGYTASAWTCTGNGTQSGNKITLGLGQNATCTITNSDKPATLIVKKVVINDNGGTLTAPSFNFSVNGENTIAFEADGQNDLSVMAGTYTVTEPSTGGYAASFSNCTGITLAVGETKTCTITNNDAGAVLIVKKVVINDDGGVATPANFKFSIDGGAAVSFEADAENQISMNAGTYSVTELAVSGYTASLSNCSNIILGVGQTKTCTITNNDVAPSLTLVKTVTNNNGGTAQPSDWTLNATGSTRSFTGTNGVSGSILANTQYTLSESAGPAGYTASNWSCNGGTLAGNKITLNVGQNVTCTINNNDNTATLIIKKIVTNDNGGTATPANFKFSIDGGAAVNFEADGENSVAVNAGTYNITEPAVSGYTASYTDCSNITLTIGQTKTCTITNNDVAPKLTLIKTVTNDNDGTAIPSDWTLTAAGPTSISGVSVVTSNETFKAGNYDLSESGPTGYTASSWTCAGGTIHDGNDITLTPGQVATCTINNNDVNNRSIRANIYVIKNVINNNGGSKKASDFTINVNADEPSMSTFPGKASPGTLIAVNEGIYDITENTVSSYKVSYGDDCKGEILAGETKTCTITNDDDFKGPDTPNSYAKNQQNSCKYKIDFKTADDKGETVRVEVYRSEKIFFTGDNSKVTSIVIGSNQNGFYIDTVPDCNKYYYYVIRAFDDADNSSGYVGDTSSTGPTPTLGAGQSTTSGGTGSENPTFPLQTVLGGSNNGNGGTNEATITPAAGETKVLGQATSENFFQKIMRFISNNALFSFSIFAALIALFISYFRRGRA